MLQPSRAIEKYIKQCGTEGYIFCADLQFFVQILDDSMLHLFDSVSILITEGMVRFIHNIPSEDPLTGHKAENRAWKHLDSLSQSAHIQVIPETEHKTAIDMYCHSKGLNYQNPDHIVLAYFLKYQEETGHSILFITADKKTFLLAKIIGLKARLIRSYQQ